MQQDIRLRGLPPLIDSSTQVLIVGTFPGDDSLAAGEYYANSRNHFWRILSSVHSEDYAALSYAHRTARLLARRVGLWDVFESCLRLGSEDKEIRDPRLNDFTVLGTLAPSLRRVLFNGGRAARFTSAFEAIGYPTTLIPSSSSANARKPLQAKADEWHRVIGVLVPPLLPGQPIVPKKPYDAEFVLNAIRSRRE